MLCRMSDIVLATLNAKYIHAAFGLRYLLANLGPLQARASIAEFTLEQRPLDIVEKLLALQPRIVGLGVYIWNTAPLTEVVSLLKRVRPDLVIVVGGPEVSYENDRQDICRLADYVVCGEGETAFAALCDHLLNGRRPEAKVIPAENVDVHRLTLPYDLYTDNDIAHRIIYVEASRGCPFSCEYCLSAIDPGVRRFPLPNLFTAFRKLLDRGVQQFKFVDRTFNLDIPFCLEILRFFLEHHRPGLFLHFEMMPDRFPPELRKLVCRFPPASLQFEIGIQTFNEEVAALIQRRQNTLVAEENLRFLREETEVHLHTDLIAGLPGESLDSFAAGFDRLVSLRPQEIQVGILKRLHGAAISRHDEAWEMTYSPAPPYEILKNKLLDFGTLQKLRRFSRYWDLVANSGRFRRTAPLIWQDKPSAFAAFMRWSDWLYDRTGQVHQFSVNALAGHLFEYVTQVLGSNAERIAECLRDDMARGGRWEVPEFLKPHLGATPSISASSTGSHRRQQRHLPYPH